MTDDDPSTMSLDPPADPTDATIALRRSRMGSMRSMALIGGLLGAFLLFAGVMAISTVPRDLARPTLTAEQHRQARAALDSQLETVVKPLSPTQAAASQSWTCLLTEQAKTK